MAFGPSLPLVAALLLPFTAIAARPAEPSAFRDGLSLAARTGDRHYLTLSPSTIHFNPSDDHRHVWLVGLERERDNGLVAGIAYFSNSFGQPVRGSSVWEYRRPSTLNWCQ